MAFTNVLRAVAPHINMGPSVLVVARSIANFAGVITVPALNRNETPWG